MPMFKYIRKQITNNRYGAHMFFSLMNKLTEMLKCLI